MQGIIEMRAPEEAFDAPTPGRSLLKPAGCTTPPRPAGCSAPPRARHASRPAEIRGMFHTAKSAARFAQLAAVRPQSLPLPPRASWEE
jgi:hypothetical protein